MLLYFVKLLGSDITQLYDLLMLRYVNYQTVDKTDSFSFRDMHVLKIFCMIQNIITDDKWPLILGLFTKRLLISREIVAVSEKLSQRPSWRPSWISRKAPGLYLHTLLILNQDHHIYQKMQ